MALTKAEVKKRIAIVKAKEDDNPSEVKRTMDALFDLVVWLSERELKEPN